MPESPIFPPTLEERVHRLEKLFREYLTESGKLALREGETLQALNERIVQDSKFYGE